MGRALASISASATGWEGTRAATVGSPPVVTSGTRFRARQDKGQRPGPEARRGLRRSRRHARGDALERGHTRQVDDQRVAPRPLLGFEDARDRGAGQRVGAEPVDGLGRERRRARPSESPPPRAGPPAHRP